MKVRIIEQPSGLLNSNPWPAAGETIDLPKVVAEAMMASGQVEEIAAKKAAEKPIEKRPASTAKVEKR